VPLRERRSGQRGCAILVVPPALSRFGRTARRCRRIRSGGGDHVITFRAGGPAFTRRRHRRMLAERAAQATAARLAEERADAVARANAAAAARRATEARQRRWDDQDRAAALAGAALAQRHALEGMAGAQALAGIGRQAAELTAAAARTAVRIADDDEALALLLAA
jgi:hypothetical protein